VKPTRVCAKIAGTSFWHARGLITAGAVGETLVNTPCWEALVLIARAKKFISTRLLEVEFTQRV